MTAASSLPFHSPLFSLQLSLTLLHLSTMPGTAEGTEGSHTKDTGRVTLPIQTPMWVIHLFHYEFWNNNFLEAQKTTNFQCMPLEWLLCQPVVWAEPGTIGRGMEKPVSFDEYTSISKPHHLWTSCKEEPYFICLTVITVLFWCSFLLYYIFEHFIIAQIKYNSHVVFNYFTKPKCLIMSSSQY